jgi:hypothetical protein
MATTKVTTPTAHNAPSNPAIIDIAPGQPSVLMAWASLTGNSNESVRGTAVVIS